MAESGSHSTPRWVKVFGIIAFAVILLFVLLMFIRGPNGHGPARHFQSDDAGGQGPLSSVTGAIGTIGGELGRHERVEGGT
jgi:hypothetical protein